MTGKEFLLLVHEYENDIIAQEEYIDALRGTLESVGVNMSGERVQSTSDPDKFGKVFAKIDEEERKLKKMQFEFMNYRLKAISCIRKVQTDKHRRILFERYINTKSFKDIAGIMAYSYDYVRELHGNALVEFEEMNPTMFPHQSP